MTATPAPVNGAELLARINPTMRRAETFLCLNPDLLDRWTAAQEELGEMRAEELTSGGGANGRLAAGAAKKVSAAVRKKAEEVQALEDEINDKQVRFVLQKMDKPTWSALTAKHPPRKDNMVDHAVGYNRESVYDAAVEVCLIDPVFDEVSYPQLLKVLGPSEWAELRDTAEAVNGKVVHAPKSGLAESLLTAQSRPRSRQPKAGG